ncbi:hypothetical protein L3V83_08950 [Thiotrichales bacterium 19X7-9]|nr:hypothetical protein [Thiotrichales bacterium 19X7-9]
MTTVSKVIKKRLIQNAIDNGQFSKPKNVAGNQVAGNVGRAMAAQLLSIINYGYNVANRSELREDLLGNEISWSESGINYNGEKYSKHSGRYIRSERNHPSREIYNGIFKFIEDNGDDPLKEFASNYTTFLKKYKDTEDEEINKIIESLSNITKLDIKTANEYVETLKVKIPNFSNSNSKKKSINATIKVFESFVKIQKSKHIKSAQENLARKIFDFNFFARIDRNYNGGDAYWLGQWETPEDILEDLFAELSFEEIEILSNHLLKTENEKLKLIKDEQSFLADHDNENLELTKHTSDYRSIMNRRVEVTSKASKLLNEDIELLGNIHIPVEFSDTGYPCLTFDLRPLIKVLDNLDDEQIVLESNELLKKYENLNNILLSYFCGTINRISQEKYGENYIEMQPQASFGSLRPSITDTGLSFRISLGLVPDDYLEVLDQAYTEFNEHIQKHFLIIKGQANNKDNIGVFKNGLNTSNKIRLHIADLSMKGATLDEIITLAERKGSFENHLNKLKPENLIKFKSGHDLVDAPHELLGIYNNLIKAYKKHQTVFSNKVTVGIDSVIDSIIASDPDRQDYSFIATKVESLCRLLQHRYELEIHNKRLETGKFNDVASIDTVLTKDSKKGIITTPSRSGMSAFRRGLLMIGNVYEEMDAEYNFEKGGVGEIYFEIQSFAPNYLTKEYWKLKDELKNQDLWFENEHNESCNVEIIDVRQFPTKAHGESKKNRWALPLDGRWNSWDTMEDSENRPDILMVDITSSTKEDLDYLYEQFNNSGSKKPYAMMFFASDNKFAQAGVDLTSMGELRLITKPESQYQDENTRMLVSKLKSKFALAYEQQEENNTAAKAYRKVLRDAGLRRSSKDGALDHLSSSNYIDFSHLESYRSFAHSIMRIVTDEPQLDKSETDMIVRQIEDLINYLRLQKNDDLLIDLKNMQAYFKNYHAEYGKYDYINFLREERHRAQINFFAKIFEKVSIKGNWNATYENIRQLRRNIIKIVAQNEPQVSSDEISLISLQIQKILDYFNNLHHNEYTEQLVVDLLNMQIYFDNYNDDKMDGRVSRQNSKYSEFSYIFDKLLKHFEDQAQDRIAFYKNITGCKTYLLNSIYDLSNNFDFIEAYKGVQYDLNRSLGHIMSCLKINDNDPLYLELQILLDALDDLLTNQENLNYQDQKKSIETCIAIQDEINSILDLIKGRHSSLSDYLFVQNEINEFMTQYIEIKKMFDYIDNFSTDEFVEMSRQMYRDDIQSLLMEGYSNVNEIAQDFEKFKHKLHYLFAAKDEQLFDHDAFNNICAEFEKYRKIISSVISTDATNIVPTLFSQTPDNADLVADAFGNTATV